MSRDIKVKEASADPPSGIMGDAPPEALSYEPGRPSMVSPNATGGTSQSETRSVDSRFPPRTSTP